MLGDGARATPSAPPAAAPASRRSAAPPPARARRGAGQPHRLVAGPPRHAEVGGPGHRREVDRRGQQRTGEHPVRPLPDHLLRGQEHPVEHARRGSPCRACPACPRSRRSRPRAPTAAPRRAARRRPGPGSPRVADVEITPATGAWLQNCLRPSSRYPPGTATAVVDGQTQSEPAAGGQHQAVVGDLAQHRLGVRGPAAPPPALHERQVQVHRRGERRRAGVAAELLLGEHHLPHRGAEPAQLGGHRQAEVAAGVHLVVGLGHEGGVAVVSGVELRGDAARRGRRAPRRRRRSGWSGQGGSRSSSCREGSAPRIRRIVLYLHRRPVHHRGRVALRPVLPHHPLARGVGRPVDAAGRPRPAGRGARGSTSSPAACPACPAGCCPSGWTSSNATGSSSAPTAATGRPPACEELRAADLRAGRVGRAVGVRRTAAGRAGPDRADVVDPRRYRPGPAARAAADRRAGGAARADARRAPERFWFVATPGDVSLCFTDPGFDVDVTRRGVAGRALPDLARCAGAAGGRPGRPGDAHRPRARPCAGFPTRCG